MSPLEQGLLATLALARGTVVSTERIIGCLWGDRHPASPRSRVQGLISSLRRKVGVALVTRHPGYLLDPTASTVDIDKCQNFAREARLARSPHETARWLRQALELWRGEPLDGVAAAGIDADRVRLSELRLALVEERYAAELDAGNHAEVVAELAATVSAHPLRERLAGQLMVALYRCNRAADALKAYQALRVRLADELGSDPCADLRNLHAAILRGDQVYQSFTATPAVEVSVDVRPAQLPASVGHFTGRDSELAALTRVIGRASDEPRVLVVSGAGGLGKTALVVRWAHAIMDQYPDGQIFVDLHGNDPDRLMPAGAALAQALAALGAVRDDIPIAVDERAALYRTLVSGRRVLIVADDAGSVDQVLPLVPPTTLSQLVVTSRRRLAALACHHAVESFPIEPLSPQATYDLLAQMVGRQRLRDPAAVGLVQWCGGWPLVIRLVATLLAARPGQSLASFADELGEHDDQVMGDDPRSVQTALAGAYRALSPAAAHLFGRLGLHAGSSFQLQRMTAAGTSIWRVRQLFDELVAMNLIVEAGPDRYRFHDVVRRFAQRCGAELMDRDVIDDWTRRLQVTVPDSPGGDAWRIPIGSEVDS